MDEASYPRRLHSARTFAGTTALSGKVGVSIVNASAATPGADNPMNNSGNANTRMHRILVLLFVSRTTLVDDSRRRKMCLSMRV